MNPYAPSQDDVLTKARHEAQQRYLELLAEKRAAQRFGEFELSAFDQAVQRPAVVAWRTD